MSSNPRLMQGQGAIIAAGAIDYPAEYQGTAAETRATLYSGINAKVHTDPPVGTASATFMTRLRTPPMPDRTATYCRPLWV